MMNPKVDEFISKAEKWQVELDLLRKIILDCNLAEEFKWGVPCYTWQNHNIVIIHGFKEYCAILFVKGALLNDADGILIRQTENVQSGRQIRFKSSTEITEIEALIKSHIFEAIEVEKAGLKVDFKNNSTINLPDEFQHVLMENSLLKIAFEALTPGRQKAYAIYFSEPKQIATRKARIEKYVPQIINGFGLHDCICGLSRKKPNCDGSHKVLK